MNNKILVITFTLSLILHACYLALKIKDPLEKIAEQPHLIKIQNIRLLGKEDGVKKTLLTLPHKKNKKEQLTKKKPTLKQLSFNEMPTNKFLNKLLKKRKQEKSISVKNFLKSTPTSYQTPSQALSAMSMSDLNIKFELPKGVEEDELNQRELVFYSFQKRAVQAYINSYVKELNQFRRKNPKKSFPFEEKQEKLAGRILYDKNGDIISIKTLAWSDIDQLQSFFMRVLKNLQTIPNPPREILENDQFAINFVLNINP